MPASEAKSDQAAGLRQLNHAHPVRVICVTSGKGGVGKSNVSVNLAMALARRDKQVMLLDADLGLANVDVILGLHPTYNISHLMSGERNLEEIMVTGPAGIKVIPASSGIRRMAELSPAEHAGMIGAFSELSDALDVMVVDSAAGISESVIAFSRASQDVLVVVCDEPASITDAYALIKLLSRDHGVERFRILANRVSSNAEGRELFEKLIKVSERFLDVTLDFLGSIPEDAQLRRAVQNQRAVVDAYPGSRSAQAFSRIATQIDNWPVPNQAKGHLQFFIERLLNAPYAQEALHT